MPINKTDVCERFSQVPWHDSELIDVHMLRIPELESKKIGLPA